MNIEDIQGEYQVLHSDERLQVIFPMTIKAARFFGEGANWSILRSTECFEDHYENGPVIIMIEKAQDGKSLLMVDKKSISFPDSIGNPIGIGKLNEDDCRTPILKWAAGINGRAIQFIDTSALDEKTCLEAVKSQGLMLDYLPSHLVTWEMCCEAVKQNEWALEYIPIDLIHMGDNSFSYVELCRKAIGKCGSVIQFIPHEFINKGMWEMAIKDDVNNIRYIPIGLITEEMVMDAITCGCHLNNIPKEFRTRNVCVEALKINKHIMPFVPESLKDELQALMDEQINVNNMLKWDVDILKGLSDVLK